jgi:hypothetical protein
MRRTLHYAAALVIFSVSATALGAARAPGQAPVTHPALSGAWVLADANPGGGKAAEQVEVIPMGGAPRPGTGASDGAGSGTSGGRGGFVPGTAAGSSADGSVVQGVLTDWGNRLPSTKPKRLKASEALRKELITPPEEFVIDLSVPRVTIDTGAGPVTYKINGKSEAHQLANGSVKTKTSWDGPLLRQVIDGGRDVRLTRVFELGLDGQLHVTVGEMGAMPAKFSAVPAGQEKGKDTPAEPRRSIYKRKG